MICPNCGVRELSPPYVDMKDLEVCSLYFGGCGYIWRVGEYEWPTLDAAAQRVRLG